MEKSSSEESAIHRSPSVDSRDSDFAQASTSGRPFGGRGFTAGAFYGSTGPRAQTAAQSTAAGDDKGNNKYKSPKGSKYVVFYLDLSFVFLLEFKKCNMARGCLCCLKYMMFVFNLIFWVSHSLNFFDLCSSVLTVFGHLVRIWLNGNKCMLRSHGACFSERPVPVLGLSCHVFFPCYVRLAMLSFTYLLLFLAAFESPGAPWENCATLTKGV